MVFVFSFSELQKEERAGLEVRLSKPFRTNFCQPDCWDGGDCGIVGLWDVGDGGDGGRVGEWGWWDGGIVGWWNSGMVGLLGQWGWWDGGDGGESEH